MGRTGLRLLHVDIQALLDNEESRVGTDWLVGVDESEPIVTEQTRNDLVDLKQGEIAANADVSTATELSRQSQPSFQPGARDSGYCLPGTCTSP